MAVRIRTSGKIVCAAMFSVEDGDTYVNDGLHYTLSAVAKILVTEPMEFHKDRGEWWWKWNVPKGIKIDSFYLTEEGDMDWLEQVVKNKLYVVDGNFTCDQVAKNVASAIREEIRKRRPKERDRNPSDHYLGHGYMYKQALADYDKAIGIINC